MFDSLEVVADIKRRRSGGEVLLNRDQFQIWITQNRLITGYGATNYTFSTDPGEPGHACQINEKCLDPINPALPNKLDYS